METALMQQIKKIYLASWKATLRHSAQVDGLIGVRMDKGVLYVLVSRSRDHEDVVTLILPLSATSGPTFRARVLDAINRGKELPYSQARRVFPAEYEKLTTILKGN